MSEFINNVTRRKETLKNILRQLHDGRSVDEVKAEFAALADEISAEEIAEVEQMLIEEGMPVSEIHNLCDVHVAVMRDALDRGGSPDSIPGHPVHTFRMENEAAEQTLVSLRRAFEAYQSQPNEQTLSVLRRQAETLIEYERHYSRKENILFPYLENRDFYGPSQVMWQTHDQIRGLWKSLLKTLPQDPSSSAEVIAAIRAILDPLEQAVRDMFYKEDKILFPTTLNLLNEEEWSSIRRQENEIGYFTVQPGNQWKPAIVQSPAATPVQLVETTKMEQASTPTAASPLPLNTGALTLEQIDLMLRHLPVDITFVDEKDEVRFFSQTPERIFPRTAAIIGRKVHHCHPPQSVHRVEQIVQDFRSGARDQAEFWIQMNGMFIHIRYFAVRDEKGAYRGTLEVSQEVSGIRALQGERRLIDGEVPGA